MEQKLHAYSSFLYILKICLAPFSIYLKFPFPFAFESQHHQRLALILFLAAQHFNLAIIYARAFMSIFGGAS